MRRIALLAVILCVSCRADRPAAPATQLAANDTAVARPSPVVAEPRKVEASAAVKALLEPDPDLDVKITPEEVKATLEAAQSSSQRKEPPPSRLPSAAPAGEEWRRLEEKQGERDAAYRARMEGTIVFAGPDGLYHSGGCPTLTEQREVVLSSGVRTLREVFVGVRTSLASVSDRRMSPHTACAPPTATYTY